MTGQQQGTDQSQFNAKADNAALALRQSLLQQGRDIPESGAVPVGPDGQPPQALPPEGSYARQAMEEQYRQQQAEQSAQAMQAAPPHQANPQQVQSAQQAQPLPQQAPTPQGTPATPAPDEVSANAQRRIGELVSQLRAKDQEHQQATAEAQQQRQSGEQVREQLAALQTQHQEMIESNLEAMDPEARAQVMMSAQVREMLAESEQRIAQRIDQRVGPLEQHSVHSDMSRVAEKYPAFDAETHIPLIDLFRKHNPNCSIEQAYRAVAQTPDELMTRAAVPAHAVPPIVQPGNGPMHRYSTPNQQPQNDPEQELREQSRKIRELRASLDPADQREGLRMADRNIAARLGNLLPGK